ncbi:MAG: DUF2934 domain-containing protein [Kofleriaceae bacterium]
MPSNTPTSVKKRPAAVASKQVVRPAETSAAPTVSTAVAPTHDQIAARAYALFVSRGCVHGHDAEDWLTAEAELNGQGVT